MELEQLLDFTLRLIKDAGKIPSEHFGNKLHIDFKGRHDLVTEYDKKTENFIVSKINETYPDHQIEGEEGTAKDGRGYKWIIDPIDGTTNFSHGNPVFAVSIGLQKDEELVLGAIYAPILNELFYASKNNGAYLNGKPIKVSEVKIVDEALMATGFNPRYSEENIPHFRHFLDASQGVRRLGAASLDMCNVAAGRLDGYWEYGLKAWDIAAGAIIIKEAGGEISGLKGEKLNLYSEQMICSNGKIHEEMVEYFKKIL